ncbi:MAG: hypothetical protein ABDI20_03080 [Candidatus Bipolaricaulaceae bacterium]
MRKSAVLAALLALALPGLAQVRVLLVDETQTLVESLRLLGVVRALRATGAFAFQALPAFPTAPWTGEPFHAVVYLPAQGPYLWFSAPWPEALLPPEFREALAALRRALAQAFASLREVRGPAEDLYPLLLALYFASRGYLGGR